MLGTIALSLVLWAVVVLLVAVAWYPLANRLFGSLPDKGISASLPLGILCTTLLVWFLGQEPIWSGEKSVLWRAGLLFLCTGYGLFLVMKKKGFAVYWEPWLGVAIGCFVALVPIGFSSVGCVFILILSAALNYCVQYKLVQEKLVFTRSQLAIGGVGILLYLVGFTGFAAIRCYVPDITFNPGASGAEKMGNLMHLTSLLQTTWFPAEDAWAAGFTSNYYYGGHLTIAVLTKLSGNLPFTAFNLAVCHTVGLILVSAYALGLALCSLSGKTFCSRTQALLSCFFALCVGIMGNADAVFQVMEAASYNYNPSLLTTLPVVNGYAQFVNEFVLSESGRGIDYWQSSRVIHGAPASISEAGTITEFPYFSALLGDMHPHHVAHPFLILGISLTLIIFLLNKPHNVSLHFFALGLLCGSLFFLNSWDSIFLTSFVAVVFFFTQEKRRSLEPLLQLLLLAGGFLLVVLLFTLYFSKPAVVNYGDETGIAWLLQKAGLKLVIPEIRTRPLEFLIHFWPLLVAVLLSIRKTPASLLLVPLVFSFGFGNILVFQALLFGFLAVQHRSSNYLPLIFMAAAVSLGVELIVIDDYYADYFERYNTLFKFYYALWPLCWAVFFVTLLEVKRPVQVIAILAVCAVGFLYPLLGSASRVKYAQIAPTFNGIQWMHDSPDWAGDAAFAEWCFTNPQGTRTLLVESPSPDNSGAYSSDGRLAALSGLPSLVGWSHHEMQWRGWGSKLVDPLTEEEREIAEFFEARRSLARQVYETGDLTLLDPYFKLYNRILIVVSNQEHLANSIAEKPFSIEPLWSTEQVTVYEYRR